MALRSGKNGNGQTVVTGRIEDIKALGDWCRSLYYVAYGSYEGEERYKKLRFIDAVSLWSSRHQQ